MEEIKWRGKIGISGRSQQSQPRPHGLRKGRVTQFYYHFVQQRLVLGRRPPPPLLISVPKVTKDAQISMNEKQALIHYGKDMLLSNKGTSSSIKWESSWCVRVLLLVSTAKTSFWVNFCWGQRRPASWSCWCCGWEKIVEQTGKYQS